MQRIAFKSIVLAVAGLILAAGCHRKESCCVADKIKSSSSQAKAGMPLPLKVKGNQVLNSKNEPVLLRGVNAASLEWTSDGEGHILETVRVAIDDWNSNIIRLPLVAGPLVRQSPRTKRHGRGISRACQRDS